MRGQSMVKLTVMENRTKVIGTPPRLMNAVTAGFNVTANHLYLLVLPVLIDVFLWLGPHVSVKKVMTPLMAEVNTFFRQANSPEMAQRIQGVSELWEQIFDSFNLLGLIRTLPIGIPSLMSSSGAVDTPFGAARICEVSNVPVMLSIWLTVIVVGFFAGCVYLCLLSQATSEKKIKLSLAIFLNKAAQAFVITVGFFILLIALTFPALMLVSVIALINPVLGDFALMFAGFLLIWILFPLVFTPQAIFTGRTGLRLSIMTSIRLVRHFLPGAGLFVIIGLVFTQGMDVLWRVPPANSWLTLVGIIGHAFIYTAVFAASFIYFRSGLRWMLENLQTAQPQEIQT